MHLTPHGLQLHHFLNLHSFPFWRINSSTSCIISHIYVFIGYNFIISRMLTGSPSGVYPTSPVIPITILCFLAQLNHSLTSLLTWLFWGLIPFLQLLMNNPVGLLHQPCWSASLTLAVATCNYNPLNLQSRHFQTRIICNYNFVWTRINCNWTRIICNQPAIINFNQDYLQIESIPRLHWVSRSNIGC